MKKFDFKKEKIDKIGHFSCQKYSIYYLNKTEKYVKFGDFGKNEIFGIQNSLKEYIIFTYPYGNQKDEKFTYISWEKD